MLVLCSARVVACESRTVPLDQIKLQLVEHDWVSTQTVEITITVHATQNQQTATEPLQTLSSDLSKIVDSSWRIVGVDRTQDSSGLEKVLLTAKTRIDQKQLTGIREQAKRLSIPGKQFEITGIDYTPSLREINTALTALREKIYDDANTELALVNKHFPGKSYAISGIDLVTQTSVMPLPVMMAGTTSLQLNNPISVNHDIQLIANVVFSAMPTSCSRTEMMKND